MYIKMGVSAVSDFCLEGGGLPDAPSEASDAPKTGLGEVAAVVVGGVEEVGGGEEEGEGALVPG